MNLPFCIYRVFGSDQARGNLAAVVSLETWQSENELQRIASDIGLPVTAFAVENENAYEVRCFSSSAEIQLCGHGLIATAKYIFSRQQKSAEKIQLLGITDRYHVLQNEQGLLTICLPMFNSNLISSDEDWKNILGKRPEEVWIAENGVLICHYQSHLDILELNPNPEYLKSFGVYIIATAPGNDCDYVYRYFRPSVNSPEDAATGSAHCSLALYWNKRTALRSMSTRQLSIDGGSMKVLLSTDCVQLTGSVVLLETL